MSRNLRTLDAARRSKAARDLLVKTRTDLILDEPFYGRLLLRMPLVEDWSCDTMWTDSVSIGYNPDFVLEVSPMELKGVNCHEVLHVILGHAWRRGSRDPEDWNRAADYAVNPIVEDAGYLLPEDALLDRQFAGKPAEFIYVDIHQDKPDLPQSGSPQPQAGDSSSDDPSQSDTGEGQQDGQPGQDGQDGQDGADTQNPSPGAGSKPQASKPAKKPLAGEVRDAPAGTDIKQLEEDWKIAVIQAAIAAEAYGELPGSLQELVDDLRRPVVNWREMLWQFAQQAFTTPDYQWRRPNRRYLGLSLYLPGLIGEQVPPLVVAWDTSSSIPHVMLEQACAELTDIVNEVRPERTYALGADARVTSVQEYEPGDTIQFEAKGRGGTDFRPVFRWVEEQGLEPCCLIYITDLEGPAPEQEPPYPVLWLTPPKAPKAPWGTQLEVTL